TDHYRSALRQTRATLAARAGAFGPLLPGAPGYTGPRPSPGGLPAAADRGAGDDEVPGGRTRDETDDGKSTQ
ncbi:hypothetical protein ACFVXQ_19500, partial [Kitasatospora sp. NPDC058263]